MVTWFPPMLRLAKYDTDSDTLSLRPRLAKVLTSLLKTWPMRPDFKISFSLSAMGDTRPCKPMILASMRLFPVKDCAAT
ncbi:hypothetical protein RRF57_009268 [Xylaria bambusicola]|uniref:Uncharacterized protein n=1 Tax=Xylaria bambusicola TaxID=326684 RepID=A0AAN7UZ76_9PEZI